MDIAIWHTSLQPSPATIFDKAASVVIDSPRSASSAA